MVEDVLFVVLLSRSSKFHKIIREQIIKPIDGFSDIGLKQLNFEVSD